MTVNNTFHIGRLTKDPELRYTPNNKAVCDFSIAVDDNYNYDTSFFDVTAWGNSAENADKYLEKGSKVHVTGRLKQDRWQTDDGSNRSKVKIVASHVEFLDGGGSKSNEKADAEEVLDDVEVDDDVPF